MGKNYNLDSVREMAGGDEDFLKIIVQTFLEEIPPDVRSMNEAIDNGNPSLAYQFAHKMKPNLELFGLNLMDQILIIEAYSKENLARRMQVVRYLRKLPLQKLNCKKTSDSNECRNYYHW